MAFNLLLLQKFSQSAAQMTAGVGSFFCYNQGGCDCNLRASICSKWPWRRLRVATKVGCAAYESRDAVRALNLYLNKSVAVLPNKYDG
jgi:hypothetical protein